MIEALLDELAGMTLDDIQEAMEGLHARTGWDWGVTITASSHVEWNTTLRVTPHPFARDTSDRSIVTHRVGPPEWALGAALADMLGWLREMNPPAAPGPCFACPDEEDGHG
jgi:hypothetical protein